MRMRESEREKERERLREREREIERDRKRGVNIVQILCDSCCDLLGNILSVSSPPNVII